MVPGMGPGNDGLCPGGFEPGGGVATWPGTSLVHGRKKPAYQMRGCAPGPAGWPTTAHSPGLGMPHSGRGVGRGARKAARLKGVGRRNQLRAQGPYFLALPLRTLGPVQGSLADRRRRLAPPVGCPRRQASGPLPPLRTAQSGRASRKPRGVAWQSGAQRQQPLACGRPPRVGRTRSWPTRLSSSRRLCRPRPLVLPPASRLRSRVASQASRQQ